MFRVLQLCFVGAGPAAVSGDRNVFLSDAGVDVSAECRAKGQVLT